VLVRVEWIACALVTVGCDELWSIDHVDPLADDGSIILCAESAHDEDDDHVADACDRCPGITDDQSDTDGDGVGDMCDPSDTTSEQVKLFVTFAEPANQWTSIAGVWDHGLDSLTYSSVGLDGYGTTLYTGTVPEPPFVIDFHFAIDSIGQQVSSFSVLLDSDDAGNGVSCGVHRQDSPLTDYVETVTADTSLSSPAMIAPLAPGGYRIRATYDRQSNVRCEIISDATKATSATMMPLNPLQPKGALGFRSFKLGATLHYVAIYKHE
jgi:hypothetical protein